MKIRPVLNSPITSAAGDIDITGIANANHASSYGINLAGSSNKVESTGSANITLTGTKTNASAYAIYSLASIGSATDSGDITIEADNLSSSGTIQSSGDLLIKPTTTSTSIGIGTGATGTLSLDNTFLDTLADGFNSITFGASSNGHDVEITGIPTFTDHLFIYGSVIDVDSDINWTNTKISLNSDKNVNINSSITNSYVGTNFDALEVKANINEMGSGNFRGIYLLDSISTVDGNVSLVGHGSMVSSSWGDLYGVSIQSNIIVTSSTGSANVTVTGVGGDGNVWQDHGVRIFDDYYVQVSDGDINIHGTTHGSIIDNCGCDFGLTAGGVIRVTGTGSITIYGKGGNSSSDNGNIGVVCNGSGITSTSGSIDITGIGDATITNNNYGIGLNSGGYITATSGTINITGTTASTGTGSYGIYVIESSYINPGSSDLTIEGTGKSYGVYFNTGSVSASSTGNISVLGDGSSSGGGIYLSSGSTIESTSGANIVFTSVNTTSNGVNTVATIGSATNSGNITIQTDTLSSTGGSIQSSGDLLIKPTTTSTSIGIGTGSTGTLNLDNTFLETLVDGFNSITIGRTDGSHVIDIAGSYTFSDPLTVKSDSITLSSLLSAGVNDIIFYIGQTSDGTLNLSNPVTAGTFTVNGGSNNDTFNFDVTDGQVATVHGVAGTNILTGPDAINIWSINDPDEGNLVTNSKTAAFDVISTLTGGTALDTFTFVDAGSISGNVDGGDALNANKLDYSSCTTDITINLTSDTAPKISGTYSNITSFTGSDTASNALTGENNANIWNITGADSGNIDSAITFTYFGNLTGGIALDTFTFVDAGSLTGNVDGGDALNANKLDYSSCTTDIAVDLQNTTATKIAGIYSNITSFTGGSGSNTLTGENNANIWNITGADTGNIDSAITFASFGGLVGGTALDTFTFVDAGSLTGSVNAGEVLNANKLDYSSCTTDIAVDLQNATATKISGTYSNITSFTGSDTASNILTGENSASTWNITGTDSGNIDSAITFTYFGDLTGGTALDTFTFVDAGSLTGNVDGGDALNANKLDYSSCTTDIAVDLQNTTATKISGIYSNITSFTGGSSTNTLVGTADPNTWNITADNAGTLNSTYVFVDFENLTGGIGRDTFVMNDNYSISGTIDGAQGVNILDYSNCTVPLYVNLEEGIATNVGLVLNIHDISSGTEPGYLIGGPYDDVFFLGAGNVHVDGKEGVNSLYGYDKNNTWVITSHDAGTLNEDSTFVNINNLTGGSLNDTFILDDGQGLSGSIDGGSSSWNILDYSRYTTTVYIDKVNKKATNIEGYSNINQFIGGDYIMDQKTASEDIAHLLLGFKEDDSISELALNISKEFFGDKSVFFDNKFSFENNLDLARFIDSFSYHTQTILVQLENDLQYKQNKLEQLNSELAVVDAFDKEILWQLKSYQNILHDFKKGSYQNKSKQQKNNIALQSSQESIYKISNELKKEKFQQDLVLRKIDNLSEKQEKLNTLLDNNNLSVQKLKEKEHEFYKDVDDIDERCVVLNENLKKDLDDYQNVLEKIKTYEKDKKTSEYIINKLTHLFHHEKLVLKSLEEELKKENIKGSALSNQLALFKKNIDNLENQNVRSIETLNKSKQQLSETEKQIVKSLDSKLEVNDLTVALKEDFINIDEYEKNVISALELDEIISKEEAVYIKRGELKENTKQKRATIQQQIDIQDKDVEKLILSLRNSYNNFLECEKAYILADKRYEHINAVLNENSISSEELLCDIEKIKKDLSLYQLKKQEIETNFQKSHSDIYESNKIVCNLGDQLDEIEKLKNDLKNQSKEKFEYIKSLTAQREYENEKSNSLIASIAERENLINEEDEKYQQIKLKLLNLAQQIGKKEVIKHIDNVIGDIDRINFQLEEKQKDIYELDKDLELFIGPRA